MGGCGVVGLGPSCSHGIPRAAVGQHSASMHANPSARLIFPSQGE